MRPRGARVPPPGRRDHVSHGLRSTASFSTITSMSEEGFEFQSLEELADAMEQQTEGPPAVEVWQDYDPSQRFIAVFPVTAAQGAAASTVAYYIFEPGRHSGLHADNAEEVIYCADGVGEVFVSGKQVKLEPGEGDAGSAGVAVWLVRAGGMVSGRGSGGSGSRAGWGVGCDAAWRPWRLCRWGRLVRSRRGLRFPFAGLAELVDAPGVAVWFV